MEPERVKADIEGVYGELAKLDAVRQVFIVKKMKWKESKVREKNDELRAKYEDIQLLQQQLELHGSCDLHWQKNLIITPHS